MTDRQASPTFGDAFDVATNDKLRMDLLGWLIWLPLQRDEELSRCSGNSHTVMYETLAYHERLGVLSHITLAEPSIRTHRRYYITDKGIYATALRNDPPYNVSALVQAYPVREHDLLELILHQETLILLNDLASRIIAEGRKAGYRLVSLQNPCALVYQERGRKHTFTSDASLILQHGENGLKHAFFVQIDGCEYTDARTTQQRLWLTNFFAARDALYWQRVSSPTPLVVTTPDRLTAWGALLSQEIDQRGGPAPLGGITISTKLEEGVFSPIWWTFSTLAEWGKTTDRHGLGSSPPQAKLVSITHLFDKKARATAQFPGEREQQRLLQSIQHTPRTGGVPARERHLAKHVRGTFMEAALDLTPAHLWPDRLLDADYIQIFALLTLRLLAQEKAILALLARHPLLCSSDLAVLITPDAVSHRAVGEYLTSLLHMGMVQSHHWDKGATLDMQTRYKLSESALRFLAERYNLSPLHYLTQRASKDKHHTEWVQRSVPGLESQMEHTVGVYRCMVAAARLAHEHADHTILSWESAYEAVQWYKVPLGDTRSQLRPDGEIRYYEHATGRVVTLLLEYDRATTRRRDYRKKFTSYSNYLLSSGQPLPPILVVTQNHRTAQTIIHTANEINPRLSVIALLEEDLLRDGLAACVRQSR